MSAEIIQHPSSTQRAAETTGELREKEREERRAKTLVERVQRLAEIENRVGKGKRGEVFSSLDDRVAAAKENSKLINEAKEKSVTVGDIKIKLADGKDRPSRIDRYTLDPDLDMSSEKNRKRARTKLMQNILGYLAVTEAVAVLTGEDEKALKLRVLGATSIFNRGPAKEMDELEDVRAVNMSLALQELAKRVIEKEKLAELFENMRKVLGQWDIQDENFRESAMACLFLSDCQNMDTHCTEVQPLPGVPLMRLLHADIHVPVEVQTAVAGRESANKPWTGAIRYDNARLRLFREIRLVIGPTIDKSTLGPMLESRAYIQFISQADLADDKSIHELRPNYTLKPVDDYSETIPAGEFQLSVEGQWHRMRTRARIDECEWSMFVRGGDPFAWAPNPLKPDAIQTHWWVSWSPVNAETIRYWFDRRRNEGGALSVTPVNSEKSFKPRWYSLDLVAHDVERSLVTETLKGALMESVKRLRAAFEEREREWRRAAEYQTGKLIAEWNRSDLIGD